MSSKILPIKHWYRNETAARADARVRPFRAFVAGPLRRAVEGTAAVLFGVNLVVVCYSVLCRYVRAVSSR